MDRRNKIEQSKSNQRPSFTVTRRWSRWVYLLMGRWTLT